MVFTRELWLDCFWLRLEDAYDGQGSKLYPVGSYDVGIRQGVL